MFQNAVVAKEKRAAALKGIMEQQKLSAADLAAKVFPRKGDKQNKLKITLMNVRSAIRTLTCEMADQLAPVLGVNRMALLVELTSREVRKTGDSSNGHAAVDLKEALDSFMSAQGLTGRKIASVLEPDDATKQELVAEEIANARSGTGLLSGATADAIAEKFNAPQFRQNAPVVTSEEPPVRRGRRKKTGGRKKKVQGAANTNVVAAPAETRKPSAETPLLSGIVTRDILLRLIEKTGGLEFAVHRQGKTVILSIRPIEMEKAEAAEVLFG